MHFRALKHDDVPTCRRLWDGVLLWEPGRWATFGREVGNRFTVLPSRAFDPQKEWGRFVTVVSAVVAKTVGMQGLVWQNHLGLSPGTLELVATKQAAHLVWLSRLHSTVA